MFSETDGGTAGGCCERLMHYKKLLHWKTDTGHRESTDGNDAEVMAVQEQLQKCVCKMLLISCAISFFMIEDINQNDDAGIKNGSLCVQLQLISASYVRCTL